MSKSNTTAEEWARNAAVRLGIDVMMQGNPLMPAMGLLVPEWKYEALMTPVMRWRHQLQQRIAQHLWEANMAKTTKGKPAPSSSTKPAQGSPNVSGNPKPQKAGVAKGTVIKDVQLKG